MSPAPSTGPSSRLRSSIAAGSSGTSNVDANTQITGRQGVALTFAEIQPGTRLAVHAEKRADGKWWAVSIKVGKTVPTPAASGAKLVTSDR